MPQPITRTAPCPHCGSPAVFEYAHPYVIDAYNRNDKRCHISARMAYCGAPARGERCQQWYLDKDKVTLELEAPCP